MTVTKIIPSGAILISAIVNGQLVKKQYQGYTITEAKKLFKEQTKKP